MSCHDHCSTHFNNISKLISNLAEHHNTFFQYHMNKNLPKKNKTNGTATHRHEESEDEQAAQEAEARNDKAKARATAAAGLPTRPTARQGMNTNEAHPLRSPKKLNTDQQT